MTSASLSSGLDASWDLFCRVIDNHGDLGVCWRLACGLAAMGARVRLWVDDASALAWMAPLAERPARVSVHPFDAARHVIPNDVVVEAFGCDPPVEFVRAMSGRAEAQRPTWINLEYLSAESYVERSHKLPSPRYHGAGAGLTKWFFYPGFTPRTGGLMMRRVASAQSGTGACPLEDWPVELNSRPRPAARRISLFSYSNSGIQALLSALSTGSASSTDLLVAPGYSQLAVQAWLASRFSVVTASSSEYSLGALRITLLPYLSQARYDAMLRSCDLNFVRGEDSLVSALDAGRPLVWQIYAQDDGAHRHKLEAFLDGYLSGADAATQSAVRSAHVKWNGLDEPQAPIFQPHSLLTESSIRHASTVCERLRAGPDLVQELTAFVNAVRVRRYVTKAS